VSTAPSKKDKIARVQTTAEEPIPRLSYSGVKLITQLEDKWTKFLVVGSEKSGIPHSGNSGTPSDSRKSYNSPWAPGR
jgi:hypothetical protein